MTSTTIYTPIHPLDLLCENCADPDFIPARLYIKIHPKKQLRYFGKSVNDDLEKYKGSGTRWLLHIKKHGKHLVENVWISDWYYNADAISEYGLAFSSLNDIVKSEKWANLMEENGRGSSEEGQLRGGAARKATMAAKPQEEKDATKAKNAETRAGWSQEEKDRIKAKSVETMTAKPQEEKDRKKAKTAETKANKSQEEKEATIARWAVTFKETLQNRSPGRSAEISLSILLARSEDWIATGPDDTEYSTSNLKLFCEEHNLSRDSMRALAYSGNIGKRGKCKGWRCRKA